MHPVAGIGGRIRMTMRGARLRDLIGMVRENQILTAAMNVAIMHAASTSVRRAVGACATSMAAILGWNPSSGTF